MSANQDFARGFGLLIQQHIDRKGWTREETAIAVWGGSRGPDRKGHVTQYVNGARGTPSAPTIAAFRDALDIPQADIDRLRATQHRAAAEQAADLNVPLAFLDRIAGQFGSEESFTDWPAFEAELQAKAADYARLAQELAALRASDDRLDNRIAQAEGWLAEGRIEDAEAALADLHALSHGRALDGVRQLARITAAQGDLALLRDDADAAFGHFCAAADMLAPLAPQEAAKFRNDRFGGLYRHGLRTGGAGLAHSAALLSANLEIWTRADHPAEWARTQNNLGAALADQGTRTGGQAGADLLAQAVAAYHAALEVHTRQDMPADWAGTQNNLGLALYHQGTRTGGQTGADLLAQAVAAYRVALEIHTRQDMPADWAMTQENIAIGLQEWAQMVEGAERVRLLREALAAVDGALQVYDPVHMSHYHEKATTLRENIVALMQQG